MVKTPEVPPAQSRAYQYSVNKLAEIEAGIASQSYASKFYLVYHTFLVLYCLKNLADIDEGSFGLLVVDELEQLQKNVLPADVEISGEFHELWKLGQSLKKLEGEEDKAMFFKLKERRDFWLNQEISLFKHLILDCKIETEDIYTTSRFIRNVVFTSADDRENSFIIELKKGIDMAQIQKLIESFYTTRNYEIIGAVAIGSTTVNIDMIIDENAKERYQAVTVTIMPSDSEESSFAFICIN